MKVSNLLTARLPIVVVLTIIMGLGLGMIAQPSASVSPDTAAQTTSQKSAQAFDLQTRPISDTSTSPASSSNVLSSTNTQSGDTNGSQAPSDTNSAPVTSTTTSNPPTSPPAVSPTPVQPVNPHPCGTCATTDAGMAIACPDYCVAPITPGCGTCGGPVTEPYRADMMCSMHCME